MRGNLHLIGRETGAQREQLAKIAEEIGVRRAKDLMDMLIALYEAYRDVDARSAKHPENWANVAGKIATDNLENRPLSSKEAASLLRELKRAGRSLRVLRAENETLKALLAFERGNREERGA